MIAIYQANTSTRFQKIQEINRTDDLVWNLFSNAFSKRACTCYTFIMYQCLICAFTEAFTFINQMNRCFENKQS